MKTIRYHLKSLNRLMFLHTLNHENFHYLECVGLLQKQTNSAVKQKILNYEDL